MKQDHARAAVGTVIPRLQQLACPSCDPTAGRSAKIAAITLTLSAIAIAALQGISTHELNGAASGKSAEGHAASSADPITRLAAYARSTGVSVAHGNGATDRPLPDVETMIGRLAARLEATPTDFDGWRMLGWSYFQLERYELAVTALEKALALKPESTDIKTALESTKASAAAAGSRPPASLTIDAARNVGEDEAALRSTVESLAARLASAPDDVEGWVRLMRSHVALGENHRATSAYFRALAHFQDDIGAKSRISAVATKLSLASE